MVAPANRRLITEARIFDSEGYFKIDLIPEAVGGGGGGLTTDQVQDLIADAVLDPVGLLITPHPEGDSITIYDGGTSGGTGGGLSTEEVRDLIGAVLVAGSGITLAVNDSANTVTISAPSAGIDAEAVRDIIAQTLVASSNISITVNDAGDTIAIASTGGSGGSGGTIAIAEDPSDAGTYIYGSSAITDELIRDTVATALVPGSGVTIVVNDASDTITINATGTTDPEVVRDTMATALVAGTNVTITPSDAGDTITISATGGGGATNASPTMVYVDPTTGSDASPGTRGGSWDLAFATIQAAVDNSQAGARIILAPTSHDVGSGIVIDRAELQSIEGAVPLYARQHASGTAKQARLYSSASTKPSSFIRIPAGTGNAYGWTIKHVYMDLDTLANAGAAIETHAVNMVLIDDVRGRALAPNIDEPNTRSLIFADRSGGDDSSWWTVRNCGTQGAKTGEIWGNYLQFPGTFAGGNNSTKPAGPALHIVEGTQPNLNGYDSEGWETGVKLTGVRGSMNLGHTGESLDTILHLKNCYDCIVIVNSTAGSGQSRVKDENGLRNTFITNLPIERISTPGDVGPGGSTHTHPVHSFQISTRGTSPSQLAPGYIGPIFGNNSSFPDSAPELLPEVNNEICVAVGINFEYWTGSAWTSWSPTGANNVYLNDQSSITIDETHKRFRIRTASSASNLISGLVYVRLTQSVGTNGTIAVRALDTSFATLEELKTPYVPGMQENVGVSQTRGIFATLPLSAGDYLEIEFDLGLGSGNTATLRRVALFSPGGEMPSGSGFGGRHLRGRATPEGNVIGTRGDMYQYISTSDNVSGLYIKVSGSNTNVGWQKVQTA
jgi:hypothetical protein